MARPPLLVAAVTVLAVAWIEVLVSALILTGFAWSGIAALLVLTALWSFGLHQVWQGSDKATLTMARAAVGIPAPLLAYLMSSADRSRHWAPAAALVLIMAAGLVLRVSPIRRWRPRTRETGVRPPIARPVLSGVRGSITLDLGEALRSAANSRLTIFGLFVLFFGCIAGFAAHSGELDQALYGGAFVLLLLAATVISYLGVIRSIGDRYRLRIDDEGIAFETGQGWIVLGWQEIRAVGMSYHLARTRKGPHLHMPQLDVFPGEPRLEPWLVERMRDDVPPAPHLGPERYRLRLPVDDTVHAAIEQAVLGYRPDLWVGWYHRRRSGTPWLLR